MIITAKYKTLNSLLIGKTREITSLVIFRHSNSVGYFSLSMR